MTLVCHPKQFVFLKSHKTASTSIEMYLERFCVPEGRFGDSVDVRETVSEVGVVGSRPRRPGDVWFNHMAAARVRDLLGHDTWNRYLKITSVRNPFARVRSSFFWERRPAPYPETDDEFAKARREFTDYVKGNWLGRRAWGNDWGTVAVDGAFQVDELVRLEHLHEDLEALCGRLGVCWNPAWLVHNKKTPGNEAKYDLKDYYTPQTERIVRREFDWVFSRLDYRL